MRTPRWYEVATLVVVLVAAASTSDTHAKKKKKKRPAADPYAEYVWPPPPDEPRIKLEDVIAGRVDVEASGKWQRRLLGASPQATYDRLGKPIDVEFDRQGRILVSDWQTKAVVRFDRENSRMDVIGTQGAVRLKSPLGLHVGPDERIYVADNLLGSVVAFDPEGKLVGVYGRAGDLQNPTDAAVSPDGSKLYVADSKLQQIVVFDVVAGDRRFSFGERGNGAGQFSMPSSLAFGPEGNLFVVDQLNCRVQMFQADGEYVDEFGGRGVGFGDFVRPKFIAIDDVGFLYVTDYAFNNIQLFDLDFSLLTFIGDGGTRPGQFNGASGVAARGNEFAVVDQIGRRVQIFRFLVSKTR